MSSAGSRLRGLRRRGRFGAVAGVAVLALGAVAVRIALIAHTPGYVPRHDDRDYVRIAWAMAQGAGYPPVRVRFADGRVRAAGEAWRPPLWPAVLGSAVHAAADPAGPLPRRIPGLTAARVTGAVLGTVGVLLTAALALRLFGRRAGWWAGALAAVYLPLAFLSTVLFSETLFVCLELASLLVALRGHSVRRAAAAGILVGLAWLTRLNGVVLLPAVVILVASRGDRRALRVVIAMAACALVVAPWTIRNAVAMHAFVPVSNETGGTLAGVYNATSMRDRRNPGSWRVLKDTPYRDALPPGTVPADADRRLRALALDFALDHPTYPLVVTFWNARRLLGLAGRARWRFEARRVGMGPRSADLAIASAWALVLLALVAVACGAARRAPHAIWLAPALLLLTTLPVNVESGRFRAPLEPFVIVIAAAGLATIARRHPRRPTRDGAEEVFARNDAGGTAP